MFDFGESGYGEYRATQSGGGSDKNGLAGTLFFTLIGLLFCCPVVYFIGCFLYYSWGR